MKRIRAITSLLAGLALTTPLFASSAAHTAAAATASGSTPATVTTTAQLRLEDDICWVAPEWRVD